MTRRPKREVSGYLDSEVAVFACSGIASVQGSLPDCPSPRRIDLRGIERRTETKKEDDWLYDAYSDNTGAPPTSLSAHPSGRRAAARIALAGQCAGCLSPARQVPATRLAGLRGGHAGVRSR